MNRSVLRASSALALTLSAAALSMLGPGAARAAEPAAGPATVGEVVVTAERRPTDIQRTAVAITAIDPATLDQRFVTNIAQLNGTVPSLQTTKAAGFENLVTIRGVGSGTPENSLTTSPGVSLFVDGVYIANTISLDQTLFDVGDIEVLRGPQGALYGQSSIGGAININTTQPKLKTFDASGDVSFGSYNLFRERAEVNLPLGDTVALRVSGQKFDHSGFTTNIYNGQGLDDAHDGSVKAALTWKPIDTFTVTATAMLYHDDRNGDAQKNILAPTPDPRQLQQDLPGKFKLTSQLYHINADWELPWFTIRSVTAVQGLDHNQQLDSDRSIYSVVGGYDHIVAWNTHLHNYTQELDFVSKPGRFEWVVGGFGLYQGSKQFVVEYGGVPGPNFSVSAPPTTYPPDILNNPPSYLNYGNLSYVKRRSYSFFGQGTFHVTEALSVTLGARYNHDYFRDDSTNASGTGGTTVLAPVRYTTNVPTYRAVIDYRLTPDSSVYLSYNRGYKPGGVNGSNLALIANTFKPETNDAVEIGSKNFLFDRTLRLNLAGFYYTHYNFQFIAPDVLPFSSGITNVPRIRDYGVEAEAQYTSHDARLRIGGDIAIERGEITANYNALDSTTVETLYGSPFAGFPGVFGTPCQYYAAYGYSPTSPACHADLIALAKDVKGNRPPAMPDVSGAINASYKFDFWKGSLTPRVEVIYRGSEWARIFNDPSVDRVPSYTTLNFNIDYVPRNAPWRVSLTATNVTDTAGINARYTDPYGTFQTSQQYIPPFQIIGTIAVAF